MMDRFSKKSVSEVGDWLEEQNMPSEVIEIFKENEMDGEALSTLIGIIPGPDCLKDLVPKIGMRLKVYQNIKAIYNKELSSDSLGMQDTSSSNASITNSSYKESAASVSSAELKRLQNEILVLNKEKLSLQTELSQQINAKKVPAIDIDLTDSSSSKLSIKKKTSFSAKESRGKGTSSGSTNERQVKPKLPNPFPIPMFRVDTEARLKKKSYTEADRKYMVQTLATMMMSYVQKPSIHDCQAVSVALHRKFRFLGCESSESTWKWFLYNRVHNVNKKTPSDDVSPPKKKIKLQDSRKHEYPSIPTLADDETSNERNLELLKTECKKAKLCKDSIKELMARTYGTRRLALLNSEYPTTSMIMEEFPILKRCTYVKYEFELVMQRSNMKEEFDEHLLMWSKAILYYCKKKCKTTTAIQTLVKNVDAAEYNGETLVTAMRCLALLLIPGKTKAIEGDIQYFIRFVSNDTPPSEAPEPSNNQPHLVVFTHEEYCQYFVAIEQNLCMESADLSMALFLLLAAHYVFNLSYHSKTTDLMKFLQEKVAKINSADKKVKKLKSPVATEHINGISREYDQLNTPIHNGGSDDNDVYSDEEDSE